MNEKVKKFLEKLLEELSNLKNERDNNNLINVSKEKEISKIEINDNISINDFVRLRDSNDEYKLLDKLCNGVLWNSEIQKINKGIFYIITFNNSIYNILLTEEKIKIDERLNIDFDELTQKENIIQEKLITINKNEYYYFSAKHEQNGNTFYTKYYSNNKDQSFGKLYLKEEVAYDEISLLINNLQNIEGIDNIIDIEFIISFILSDIKNNILKRRIT